MPRTSKVDSLSRNRRGSSESGAGGFERSSEGSGTAPSGSILRRTWLTEKRP